MSPPTGAVCPVPGEKSVAHRLHAGLSLIRPDRPPNPLADANWIARGANPSHTQRPGRGPYVGNPG